MRREFDNDNYHIEGVSRGPNRTLTTIIVTICIIFLVYLVTIPFRGEKTDSSVLLTEDALDGFDYGGDLSELRRGDLEFIIHNFNQREIQHDTEVKRALQQQYVKQQSDLAKQREELKKKESSLEEKLTGLNEQLAGLKKKEDEMKKHQEEIELLEDELNTREVYVQQEKTQLDQRSTAFQKQIDEFDKRLREEQQAALNKNDNDASKSQNNNDDNNKATNESKTNKQNNENNTSSQSQTNNKIPPLFDGHEIIVTLTTIPDRMQYLNATLLSLVTQTIPPTEIVLNIPFVSRRFFHPDGSPIVYDLPIEFIEFINALGSLDDENVRNSSHFPFTVPKLSRIPRITIHRCDDDGPATKLLPTLAREFAIGRMDSILIIADDDVIYPPNWAESLVGYYLSKPELHYTAVGARGYCAPPSNVWDWTIVSQNAFSGLQLYNITKNLNEPYRFNDETKQYDPHFGSPLASEHRTLVTPNAHRFIFRNQNFTKVVQNGGRSIKDTDTTLPDITTNVEINPDWSFAHLFDQKHPSYRKNKWHTHDTNDHAGTINDARRFINDELQYNNLYTPIEEEMNTILPHIPHKKEFMSHSAVDIITGNNGFLLRPYYFLRYSPFIGNITRFTPEVYNSNSFRQYHSKYDEYAYTTHNNYFSKIKKFYQNEYLVVKSLITDMEQYITEMNVVVKKYIDLGRDNDDMKLFWSEQGTISAFKNQLFTMMQQSRDIRKKLNAEQEAALRKKLKGATGGRSTVVGPNDEQDKADNHIHPELDAKKLPESQYHIEHRRLHMKLDYIENYMNKFELIMEQYGNGDIPLQYSPDILSSPLSNIINFGQFPYNLTAFHKDLMELDHNDIELFSATPPKPYDFSLDTRSSKVLGSDPDEELPESVYYMDDIWFNGILAANDVSRVVVSLTIDPIHRPKMQEATTTLEQVPIGRSFHNNVLLKAFEQYWTNCPQIVANITIPSFYLRYYALASSPTMSGGYLRGSGSSDSGGSGHIGGNVRAQIDDVLKKKNGKDDQLKTYDDYRNSLSNPWAEWDVPDNETNVATQLYFYNQNQNQVVHKAPDLSLKDKRDTDYFGKKVDLDDPNAKVDSSNISDMFRQERERKKQQQQKRSLSGEVIEDQLDVNNNDNNKNDDNNNNENNNNTPDNNNNTPDNKKEPGKHTDSL